MRGYPRARAKNLVVHRLFSPFVGAGLEQGGLSFTVDPTACSPRLFLARNEKPTPFREVAPNEAATRAVRALVCRRHYRGLRGSSS